MKRYLSLVTIVLITATYSLGQFGVSAKYQSNNTSGWDDVYDGITELEPSGIEYGINYWLRLKNKRIEFLPEITYASSNTEYLAQGFAIELSRHKRSSIGLGVNTHIYPLDFEGDCNCPTFSKDGNLVSKGFHWIINTAVINHSIENTFSAPLNGLLEPVTYDESSITARVGLGAGLDIGITELITIVPFGLYTRNFGLKGPNATLSDNDVLPSDAVSSSLDQLHFGLRLVFRPDYIKSNGGFRRR